VHVALKSYSLNSLCLLHVQGRGAVPSCSVDTVSEQVHLVFFSAQLDLHLMLGYWAALLSVGSR